MRGWASALLTAHKPLPQWGLSGRKRKRTEGSKDGQVATLSVQRCLGPAIYTSGVLLARVASYMTTSLLGNR